MRKRNLTAWLSLPLLSALVISLGKPAATAQAAAVPSSTIRAAVERALPKLQSSAAAFIEKRPCFSCHHNALPILMLHAARDKGLAIDAAVLAKVEERTFRELRGDRALDNAVQATALIDPTPNDSLLLMAAEAAGVARDWPAEVIAARMATWQRDGHWITSDFRPPHSSSLFTATATAVRAMRVYMPPELSATRDRQIQAAANWLLQTTPASTEDASFRLMGLVWASAPRPSIEAATKDLIALRNSDGGWPQLAGYSSDAYSAGQAVYALREAGVAATDPLVDAGIRFLLKKQARDGTWRVPTRMRSPAQVSPPYVATGFPYGKDEFISYAGSTWAVLGLLSALPGTVAAPVAAAPWEISLGWVRTALFGTVQELTEALDKGLDANQQTENGTTLLMMAAGDPGKVRLLLARGAHSSTRARSNVDALTVAASYYGNAAALELLLAAGAEPNAPEDVRVQHTPLGLATLSGDLASVKLLLEHGADASEGFPLGEAITYNHPQVAQALLKAGASASAVESTGINLLHWATITDRPLLIPVLIEAGVPLDDVDDHGYTALMYAASIDFGDTQVLDALLAAGVDTAIKDYKGRTALQHARSLKHAQLEARIKGAAQRNSVAPPPVPAR